MRIAAAAAVIMVATAALAGPLDSPMVPMGADPMVKACGPMVPSCGPGTPGIVPAPSPPPVGCTADGKADFSNPCDIGMFMAVIGL